MRKIRFRTKSRRTSGSFCPGFRNLRNILFVFRAAALCAPAEPSIRAGYTDWFRNHRPVKQIDCSAEGIKKEEEDKIVFCKGKNDRTAKQLLVT